MHSNNFIRQGISPRLKCFKVAEEINCPSNSFSWPTATWETASIIINFFLPQQHWRNSVNRLTKREHIQNTNTKLLLIAFTLDFSYCAEKYSYLSLWETSFKKITASSFHVLDDSHLQQEKVQEEQVGDFQWHYIGKGTNDAAERKVSEFSGGQVDWIWRGQMTTCIRAKKVPLPTTTSILLPVPKTERAFWLQTLTWDSRVFFKMISKLFFLNIWNHLNEMWDINLQLKSD